VEISRVSLLISPRPSRKVLEKSKFFKGKDKMTIKNINTQNRWLYVQISSNIKKIIKIKENFPSLSFKKIKEVYKVINEPRKEKPKINIVMECFGH